MTKRKPQITFRFDDWLTTEHMVKQLHSFINEINEFSYKDLDPVSTKGSVTIYWEPAEFPKSLQEEVLKMMRPDQERVKELLYHMKSGTEGYPHPDQSLPENLRKIREEDD